MLDLSVKLALSAAAAWILTRRVTPANAAAAHRLWLVVLSGPIVWLLAGSLIAPIVFVHPRVAAWPQFFTAPDADTLAAGRVAYVAIACLLLVRVAAGVVSVQRLLQRSSPLTGGELARLRHLAGRPTLDIRQGGLRVPVTAGFVRPAIILPREWRTLGPDAIAAIVHHEAAHVGRRDCTVALACAVAEALFWFNPAVWVATSRVRWFAEMAADADAACAMTADAYAAQLLGLAEHWNRVARPSYAMTAGANTGVTRRVGLLIDGIERRPGRRAPLSLAAAAVLVLLVLSAVVSISGRGVPIGVLDRPHDAAHAALHRVGHGH